MVAKIILPRIEHTKKHSFSIEGRSQALKERKLSLDESLHDGIKPGRILDRSDRFDRMWRGGKPSSMHVPPPFQYKVNHPYGRLTIHNLSTVMKRFQQNFRVVSNLVPLLKERGRTQSDLAKATGLKPLRIYRTVRRRVVSRIVCDTAIRICLALSDWPRVRDRRKVRVRLDTLFSFVEDTPSSS